MSTPNLGSEVTSDLWKGPGESRGPAGRDGRPLANHVGLGSARWRPVFDTVFQPGFGEGDLGVSQVASQAECVRATDGVVSGDGVPVLSLRLLFFFFFFLTCDRPFYKDGEVVG